MEFENFGVDEEGQIMLEYEAGDDVYEVERTLKQVGGEEVYTDRIKLDENVLEVRRKSTAGLVEETAAYDQLLSYLSDSKLEESNQDAWGSRESELEKESPVGGVL